MRGLEIYIKSGTVYEKLDIFEDEAVSITQRLKDIRDIAKINADYTQSFTVPASANNNKVFKHCYNYNITDGFDVRFLVDAKLELNYYPFKNGYIRLDGVEMKSGIPNSYKITFFGSIIKLKDVFGSDKISDLPSADLDLSMDITDFSLALTKSHDDVNQPEAGYIVPLITSDQDLYHDYGIPSQDSGNLHYTSQTRQGLRVYGLKYAIKLSKLIDYIETDYNITFASDSFFKDTNKDVQKLYMWLSSQTDVIDVQSGGDYEVNFTNLVGGSAGTGTIGADGNIDITATGSVFLTVADANRYYDVNIKINGAIQETLTREKDLVFNHEIEVTNGDELSVTINTYENDVTIDDPNDIYAAISITRTAQVGQNTFTDTFKTANTLSFNKFFVFNVAKNMPNITVINFISGLFKMFNLVAFVKDNGEIQVTPLSDYYASGETINITKYIDRDKSQINTATIYDNIMFEYDDTKSILAEQHKESISPDKFSWGGVRYDNNLSNLIQGKKYEVKVPFAHMKFERVINRRDLTDPLSIQYGVNLNIEGSVHKSKPLLFYSQNVTLDRAIAYVYTDILSEFVSGSTINIPLNSPTTTSTDNIHFNPEFNEYSEFDADPDTETPAGVNTLFKRFYEDYISNIFDSRSRLIKVTCYLPNSVISTLTLDDKIVIQDNAFRVNSMKVDLSTGKTAFELITI